MSDKAQSGKQKAYRWGLAAEWLSIVYLVLKGYRILARRFRCKSGEIDLVAQKRGVICFIEVKARRHKQDALSAVSYGQQQRITRAAEWYLVQNIYGNKSYEGAVSCRFDVMAVEPWALPTHVKDAWQQDMRN